MNAAADPTEAAALLAAAARVDVVDLAGRIIAHPRRAIVSTADQLALALAFEKVWAIALEGELLARAVQLPVEADDQARDHAIETQAAAVRRLMDEITGKEPNDGNAG